MAASESGGLHDVLEHPAADVERRGDDKVSVDGGYGGTP